jgi:hypothetical protein
MTKAALAPPSLLPAARQYEQTHFPGHDHLIIR